MFNVAIDEIFVILFVCLVVFEPKPPQVARQAGRLTGQPRLLAQGVLGQPKQEPARPCGWARCAGKPASASLRVEGWTLVWRAVTPWGAGRERLRWR